MVAHAESCPRCTATLSEEQALTSDLRALAAATEDAETPERVERALRAAVRERQSERLPAPIPRLPSARPWRWGIAAALLLASGLAAARLGWRFAPVSRQTPAPSPGVADTMTEPKLGSAARAPRKAATRAPTPAPVLREKPAAAERPVVTPAQEASVTIEDGAEFVPLDYDDTLADVESVHVVRVQLPPAALTALGWPAGEGTDSRPVSADLLVGHDGRARAIRFVQ